MGPETLALVSAIVTIGGTTVSLYSQVQQDRYNRKVAKVNREIADQERERNFRLSVASTQERRERNARSLAKLRNSYSAYGLVLSGSALDVLDDSGHQLAKNIRWHQERTASFNYASDVERLQAENAERLRSQQANYDIIGGAFELGGSVAEGLGRLRRSRKPA